MAEAVSATVTATLKGTHTLPLSLDCVSDSLNATVELNGGASGGSDYDITATLNASSAAPVTKIYSDEITLTAGAATIDLTSLTGFAGTSATWAGLKVQAILISTNKNNTDAVTFAEGGTNGYAALGSGWTITLGASGKSATALFYLNEGAPDVGASDKTIDVTSSDTDAKFRIVMVAG